MAAAARQVKAKRCGRWRGAALAAAGLLGGCGHRAPDPYAGEGADRLFRNLASLCGQSFRGGLLGGDASDAAMRQGPLSLRVVSCTPGEVRMALTVGEDRSRTWVVSRHGAGRLALRHVHLEPDGRESALSGYGGESAADSTEERARFPADAATQALFRAQGRGEAAANVWSLELRENRSLTYGLDRPGRSLRLVFDLAQPAP